jgi:hypothetical protein
MSYLRFVQVARASRSGFQDNPDRDGLATVWTHPPQPRIEFPGAFYHVMARGNRCESISHDDDDRRFFKGERTF